MRSLLHYSVYGLVGVGLALACSGSDEGGGTAGSGTGGVGAVGGGGAGTGGTAGTTSGGSAGTASGGVGAAAGSGGSGATAGAAGAGDSGLPDVSFSYDASEIDAPTEACAAVTAEAKSPPVDIIWIIDQSCSMGTEITQVRTNINGNFANIIQNSGLDYRVIMFAHGTSGLAVCVNPPLGAGTTASPLCGQNKPPQFYQVNTTIQSTDSFSKFMLAANWNQIKAALRPGAFKAFIEVTDDQSGVTAAVFDTWLLTGGGAGYFGTVADRRYVFHSIIGVDKPYLPTQPKVTTKCASAVNAGPQYQDISILTGGLRHPVCDTNYSTVFQNIANSIVQAVACELQMPQTDAGIVDPNKIQVQYTPGGTGTPIQYGQVANAGACVGDGFYYDNPASPTKVTLCPQNCTTVKNDSAAKVELLLGCLGS